MQPFTKDLWAKQDQHAGDRWRLFRAVGEVIEAGRVLYPGSYVDVAPLHRTGRGVGYTKSPFAYLFERVR